MTLPVHTINFRYAKQLVMVRYVRIDDVRPATVEIRALYLGGEQYSREEAEGFQYGNASTLWDEADHRCWMDAYGPDLRTLRKIETEIADASAGPEFQAALAHAATMKAAE